MSDPIIHRTRNGKLTLAECDPVFLCARESLEDIIGRHNEKTEQLAKIEEDEARLCPEGQSWQETLEALRRERDEARAALEDLLADGFDHGMTKIRAARKALASLKGGSDE